MPRVTRLTLPLALAFALSACERGCLSGWLAARGVGGTGPGAGGAEQQGSRAPQVELSGTDCSGGLARCAAGQVEVSRDAHLPHPCRPGACACPWEAAARCASGCALEGAEVFATPELAGEQLCRSPSVVARPLLAADPPAEGVCSTAGMTCEGGMLRWCEDAGKPVRAAGFCLHGCEPRIGLSGDHGAARDLDGAASILCRRLDAERR